MVKSLLAAWAFYTHLPTPQKMELDFSRIVRWAPLIGLIIGGLLSVLDWGLDSLAMPILVRSTFIVLLWLALTGGLHLDGAMDSADGLAVTNPERRLAVMADSNTGAFGVMSAIAIILLKIVGLSAIGSHRWMVLLALPAWGRWAQVLAVVLYPYLKAEGKGAMHSKGIVVLPDLGGSFVAIALVAAMQIYSYPDSLRWILAIHCSGLLLSYPIGNYFARRLGGHTGDTYGATVEWVEAIGLLVLSLPYWSS
jgi:adenosylcobinamide-GDP ribazoletransferase